MQLREEDLHFIDAINLGYIPKVPMPKDLYEAQRDMYRDDPYHPDPDMYLKYLHLKRIEYAYTLYQPRYGRGRSYAGDRDYLSTTITQMVWGKENKDLFIEYPETWWDAFKNRWFPNWLLRRFPTYWIEWYIDSNTLYPLLDINDTSNLTHTLVYTAYREEEAHREKIEVGLRYGYRFTPKPETFWQKFVQFVKDCVPP